VIEPISAVEGVRQVETGGAARAPELQQLSDHFNSMMAKDPDPGRFSEQHLQNEPSTASEFIRTQEQLLQRTSDDFARTSIDAPNMTMQELTTRNIQLSFELADVQLRIHAGMDVAQSGKTALQTLMKNQ
jgi:type III secretion inner rod protein HrpB2